MAPPTGRQAAIAFRTGKRKIGFGGEKEGVSFRSVSGREGQTHTHKPRRGVRGRRSHRHTSTKTEAPGDRVSAGLKFQRARSWGAGYSGKLHHLTFPANSESILLKVGHARSGVEEGRGAWASSGIDLGFVVR